MTPEFWYRYNDVQYAAPLNEWGEPVGEGRVRVHLTKFPVLRHTPKGVWLDDGGERWVSRYAHKRFACATKAEAAESFIARKNAQRRILNAQLRRVDKALVEITRVA